MQALAPHRNVCHSHLSFKKYADITNYYIPSLNTLIITIKTKASQKCEAFVFMYIFLAQGSVN